MYVHTHTRARAHTYTHTHTRRPKKWRHWFEEEKTNRHCDKKRYRRRERQRKWRKQKEWFTCKEVLGTKKQYRKEWINWDPQEGRREKTPPPPPPPPPPEVSNRCTQAEKARAYEEYSRASKIAKKSIKWDQGKVINMVATENRRGGSPRKNTGTVLHHRETRETCEGQGRKAYPW